MRNGVGVPRVHGVHRVDVGRGLVHEALAGAVDQQAAGQAALGQAEVRAGRQRDGRAPPGVVHQVERGTRRLARGDRIAGVAGRPGGPLGADRRALVVLPHHGVALEAARRQHHTAARPDQRGLAVAGHRHSGSPAVLQVQAGHRGVQPDRNLPGRQARPQARGQCLAHAEHVLPEQAGAGHPAGDLHAGEHRPGMPGAQAQPAVVGLGDRHAGRCGQVGRVEMRQFGAEDPAVHGPRFDAAAFGQAARGFRVIVGVARHPGEVHRGVRAHEIQHGRALFEQCQLPFGAHAAVRDVGQVGAGLLGRVGDPGPAQHLVPGYPQAAAGTGGGAAEPAGLLDHHDPQAVVRGRECGGHPGGATAHHHDLELAPVRCHGASRALILEHVTVLAERAAARRLGRGGCPPGSAIGRGAGGPPRRPADPRPSGGAGALGRPGGRGRGGVRGGGRLCRAGGGVPRL